MQDEDQRSALSRRLPAAAFEAVVRDAPLVSIDLIVRSPSNRILLGRRRNEPACGTWFVPGGRIYKDERLADAFARTAREELRAELAIHDARFLGVFEHLYAENFAKRPGFGTHYVVLAFEVTVADLPDPQLQDQHDGFQWFTVGDLLQSPAVHPYTRAYFSEGNGLQTAAG